MTLSHVKLKNVTKYFKDVKAVDNVNLEIKKGELFTFLGPSGCGKTTILRMIAGFYYPTEGSIYFDDKDVTYLPANRRNAAMVFQSYALFPHLSVEENVAFGLKVRKVPQKEQKEMVKRALEMVKLAGYEKRRIDQLSGGQQQRVALARALVIKPTILLLDEPLSNLDAKLREETRWEIRKLQKELGITTIYVTHDQSEAMAMSDRIAVMEGGKIQQVGTPEEIYFKPANRFVASFIGKTNFIEAVIEDFSHDSALVRVGDEIRFWVDSSCRQDGYIPYRGDRVMISIRPEAMEIVDRLGKNVVKGRVRLAEFTGVTMEYEVEMGGITLHISTPGIGKEKKSPGDEILVHLPPRNMLIMRGDDNEMA